MALAEPEFIDRSEVVHFLGPAGVQSKASSLASCIPLKQTSGPAISCLLAPGIYDYTDLPKLGLVIRQLWEDALA